MDKVELRACLKSNAVRPDGCRGVRFAAASPSIFSQFRVEPDDSGGQDAHPTASKMLALHFSDTLLNTLRSLARKNGKTLEQYARSILEQATRNSSETEEEYQNLIEQDLVELDESELKHLEKEFEDYEQLYPRR